jgi:hypothetical protein
MCPERHRRALLAGNGLDKGADADEHYPNFHLEVFPASNWASASPGFPRFGSYHGFLLRLSVFRFRILSAPGNYSAITPKLDTVTGAQVIAPSDRSNRPSPD